MTQGTPMTTLFPGAPPVPGLLAVQLAAGESASPFANLFARLTDPATGAPISINPEIVYAPLPPAAILPKNAASSVAQTAKETPETQTEPETTMSNSPLWMAMAGAVLTPAPSAPIRLPEAKETSLQAAPATEITVERSAPSSNASAVPPVVSPYPEQTDALKARLDASALRAKSPEERLLSGRLASSPPGPAEPDVPAPARGAPPPIEKPPPEPNAPQPIPNRSMQAPEVDAVSKTIGEPKAPLSFPIETPEGSAPVSPSAKTVAALSAPSDAADIPVESVPLPTPAPTAPRTQTDAETEPAPAKPAPAAKTATPAPSVSPDAAAKPVRSPALAAEPVRPAQTPPALLASRPDDSAVVLAPVSSRESGAARQKEAVVIMTTGRPAEVNGEQAAAPQSADMPEAGAAPLRKTPVATAPTAAVETPTMSVPPMAAPLSETPLRPSVPRSEGILQAAPAETRPEAAFESERKAVTIQTTSFTSDSASPVPHGAAVSQTAVLPDRAVLPTEFLITPAPALTAAMRGVSFLPAEAPAQPVTAYTLAAASPETAYPSGTPLPAQKAVPLLDSVQKEAVLSRQSIPTAVKTAVPMPEASVTDPRSSPQNAAMPLKARLDASALRTTGGDAPAPMAATAPPSPEPKPHTPAVSGAFAAPQPAAPAEPEVRTMEEITPPETIEAASAAAIRPPKSALSETQLSLSAMQRETAAGTGAGQPDPDSPSGGETGIPGVREQAAVRTANAAMTATAEPETVSENRHPSAKTETAASTATSAADRSNPLIARSETVSEEEAVVVQTRGEAQRTAAERLFQRETPKEGGDRSEPVRGSAPVAADPESADAGGDPRAAVAPAAASAHASRTAQPERAEPPAAGQQDRVRVVQQVLQKLETMRLTQGRQEITLHLKPEHLGHLQVTIVTDRENVFARIVAETSQVRQAVEMGRDALRDALEQKGLTLQHLDVSSQQGHGGGRQMPFVPELFASSARPYRMPGIPEAGEIETPRPFGVTPSRLAGRLDYVA